MYLPTVRRSPMINIRRLLSTLTIINNRLLGKRSITFQVKISLARSLAFWKQCNGCHRLPRMWERRFQVYFARNKLTISMLQAYGGCRGRTRTSTRRLAIAQCSKVVNPSRLNCLKRHYTTFIPWPSPPRQEGMSAKNSITPQSLISYQRTKLTQN